MTIEPLIRALGVEQLLLELDRERRPSRHRTVAIPDTKLLRALLPAEPYEKLMAAGFTGMHALSFALRHRLSYLAVLAHLAACAGENPVARLPHNTEADLAVDFATVARFPWHGGGPPPIIGFAASGAFVAPAHAGICRAFDPYDLPRCTDFMAQGSPFCGRHADEAWWGGLPDAAATTLAKMCAFYFSLPNFGQYDEATLAALVSGFLRRVEAATFSPEEAERALDCLGFANRSELAQAGKAELRRRFLQAAHLSHPDKGGEASDFVALRRSYDVLLAIVETPLEGAGGKVPAGAKREGGRK